MSTEMYEFQSHNSPWTEMYDMHCQREDASSDMSMADPETELEPTYNALADVYNREETDNKSKRF